MMLRKRADGRDNPRRQRVRSTTEKCVITLLGGFLVLWLCCVLFTQSAVESLHSDGGSVFEKKLQSSSAIRTAQDILDAGDTFNGNAIRAVDDMHGNAAISSADKHESALERVVVPVHQATPSNPWYGWQPKIADVMQCSWRECFKPDHKCTTCRDDIDDMGVPPVPDADWVPDVTMLRRMMLESKDASGNFWPPKLDEELCEPMGHAGGPYDDNGEALRATEVVAKSMVSVESTKGPKILCMVYTMVENHATSIRAIRETWGGGCDGFLAFSTGSDPRIPAISLPHDGVEAYHNMWQKVRSMWKFIGQHYLEDFDYFFIGGEDLYVLPQNLRSYLGTLGDSEELHFAGRRFKGYGTNNYFNSGGSGYALSRGAVRKLYNEGLDHPKCNPHKRTSMEDVMVAECLREAFGIGLTDTRDEQHRERFHPFAPASHYKLKPNPHDWYDMYNTEWGILYGKDCCAPDSVSYHYMKKPSTVRHIHALLYHCPKNVDSAM